MQFEKIAQFSIIHGDTLKELPKIPENSIDLCITSPPYWGLRTYNLGEEELGTEPTMEKYLDNTLVWVKEVYRVLKPSGSFVLNIGDCFVGSGGGGTKDSGINPNNREAVPRGKDWKALKSNGTRDWKANSTPNCVAVGRLEGIYKTKQLLAVSHFAYCKIITETDFICRGVHIWCLEENTPLVVMRNGRKEVVAIKNIKGDERILTPNQQGNMEWTPIKGIYKTGQREGLRIILTNGLSVECSEEHIFPIRGGQIKRSGLPYLQIQQHKKAKNICPGEYLMVAKKFPNPHQGDANDGFVLGFYLAEGNIWLDKRKGNTVPTVMFSCHVEKDRSHIERMKAIFNIKEYHYHGKEAHLRSRDRRLISMLKTCVEGGTSKDKHLSELVFSSTSTDFMHGVLEGFCAGDAHYRAWDKFPSYRIGITNNKRLMQDLMILCRFVGWDFRFQSDKSVRLNGKEYPSLRFALYPSRKRNRFGDIEMHKIRSVKRIGLINCYDIEVKQKYPDYRAGKAWNNLFCLANGIITHNCKPNVPSPIRSRLKHSHEYLYWFVKDADKYYFDEKPWMKPTSDQSIARAGRNSNSDGAFAENIGLSPTSCYRKKPVKRSNDEQVRYMREKAKGAALLETSEEFRTKHEETAFPSGSFHKYQDDVIEHSWRVVPVGAKQSGFELAGKQASEHIAPYPEELIRPYIKSLAPINGTVLDPFLGSGTTMRVALEEGRNCTGIELSERSIQYAKRRLNWGQGLNTEYQEFLMVKQLSTARTVQD